jgi:hypothetical protein
MAGNILEKYAASTAPTVTNLQSVASAQDWSTGWGSATFTNTSNAYQDYFIGATFTTASASRQAGFINVYIIASLNDTPTFPVVASGTLGTEGAISFTSTQARDAACRLLATIAVTTTNAAIYVLPETAIAALFNGRCPTHFVIYIAQNATTTTTAGLASSGNAVYVTGDYTQYT